MLTRSFAGAAVLVVLSVVLAGCPDDGYPPVPCPPACYSLDKDASGVLEKVNNIANLTVVSRDENDLRAEYRAGFVQGKLQGRTVLSTRDNTWNSSYLLDPGHTFPKQPVPTRDELDKVAALLNQNYAYLINFLRTMEDADTAHKLSRLLFRMLGIYHGANLDHPEELDFSGDWLPDPASFPEAELSLGYETPTLSFMDLYFINAYCDVMDVISFSGEKAAEGRRIEKCSGFVKRTADDVLITHNSWYSFLSQTMGQTIMVNGDFMTCNAISAGLVGSNADFGYNNKGILFNETTHRSSQSVTRTDAIWIFWRATLAEQFSTSIDDFFRYISLDNSGTYLNGYMVVDAKNSETALVEMSYRCFVFYRSLGGPYTVTTKPEGFSTEYDPEIVTPGYIMGINFPASYQVRDDLKSTDNRPARRVQFKELLPGVNTVEDAKRVITYTDPENPLSIYGRWDLGYGETDYPKMVPDGSIDAKAAAASMALASMNLEGKLDRTSGNRGIWMRYGTPHVNGHPFIWSRSSWSWQKLRDVPNVVDGAFTWLHLNLR
jgi:hypothetical protein